MEARTAAKAKKSVDAEVPDHRMVEKWIVDSGCGHDLVARILVASFPDIVFKVDRPITFNTANGLAPSTDQARIGVKELGQVVKAWIMEKSPAVLSLGRRCMQDGFDFIWRFGRTPYFVTECLKVVKLIVKGDIPYLFPGSPYCQPVDPDDECPLPPWRASAASAPAARVATSESGTQTDLPADALPSSVGGSSASGLPRPPSVPPSPAAV